MSSQPLVAWIQADLKSFVALESNGLAVSMFQRVRGDQSQKTRVFAYTQDHTATAGNYFVNVHTFSLGIVVILNSIDYDSQRLWLRTNWS